MRRAPAAAGPEANTLLARRRGHDPAIEGVAVVGSLVEESRRAVGLLEAHDHLVAEALAALQADPVPLLLPPFELETDDGAQLIAAPAGEDAVTGPAE